jgi:hypothetical protein
MNTTPATQNLVTAAATDTAVGEGRLQPVRLCPHQPPCPGVDAPDRDAAYVRVAHPEQGWSLLCNGIVLFDDTGELLPDGRIIPPHRAHGPTAA